jgi:hypothetical protein
LPTVAKEQSAADPTSFVIPRDVPLHYYFGFLPSSF